MSTDGKWVVKEATPKKLMSQLRQILSFERRRLPRSLFLIVIQINDQLNKAWSIQINSEIEVLPRDEDLENYILSSLKSSTENNFQNKIISVLPSKLNSVTLLSMLNASDIIRKWKFSAIFDYFYSTLQILFSNKITTISTDANSDGQPEPPSIYWPSSLPPLKICLLDSQDPATISEKVRSLLCIEALYRSELEESDIRSVVTDALPGVPKLKTTKRFDKCLSDLSKSHKGHCIKIFFDENGTADADVVPWAETGNYSHSLCHYINNSEMSGYFIVRAFGGTVLIPFICSRDRGTAEAFLVPYFYRRLVELIHCSALEGTRIDLVVPYRYQVSEKEISSLFEELSQNLLMLNRDDQNSNRIFVPFVEVGIFEEELESRLVEGILSNQYYIIPRPPLMNAQGQTARTTTRTARSLK